MIVPNDLRRTTLPSPVYVFFTLLRLSIAVPIPHALAPSPASPASQKGSGGIDRDLELYGISRHPSSANLRLTGPASEHCVNQEDFDVVRCGDGIGCLITDEFQGRCNETGPDAGGICVPQSQ
ncbi:hypothetical protein BDK51DRAFT_47186 [Blyttiomyces helicus]|uniref:Uncharacterized protein n=1 Tax=Blyttiomyces helicus TaxID=388810 RepID=A0A4P9VZG0_9FUNG|nr:hypothetical protein BDK51DRAFT_47186 [Blyttiomyces helicus]|eukprot:RKO85154.1 hypothetical protein BDK51DRAFT_47186 [Blyttiomyces helicus]